MGVFLCGVANKLFVAIVAPLRYVLMHSRKSRMSAYCTDLDPDPSNIKQHSKKTLDFSCFVTSFYRILLNYDVTTS
jgi:hypothetical protein